MSSSPIEPVLDALAAPTPAPGGGTAAAWTCAMAAALVEMAAAFTLQRPDEARQHERMRHIASRACALRAGALAQAEREKTAYEPVLAALKRPRDDPQRAPALRNALQEAAEPPLAISRLATEVAELALEAAGTATKHLRGDALAAQHLADGAAAAAARLARLNLVEEPPA